MPEDQTDRRAPAAARLTGTARQANPWHALWAMLVGFFMILVDSTIVAVANKRIMEALATDYDGVIWVTSAYLLAYAVPLLVAGRLGDRFGPKNLYLLGLTVFTIASLWCGLSGSIQMLIAARVVQGVGAALLTPQTLSTITRIFPPERRGVAMSVWGATAGVATLVGPLAGGVLVDGLGWQWIFFVNVPIGLVGLALAAWLVPVLPTEKHSFDLLGVALSGIAMLLIVFGLQEGQSHHWAPWIWATIVAGVGFMVAFVYWQSVNPREPLIPLRVFADRDFTLSNVGIAVIGFAVTAMILPVMFYAPAVCGLSYTRSALLTAPMAIATGVLAPFVGRIVDRSHPAPIIGFGFATLAIALTWLSVEMTPTTPIWRLLLPLAAMGVGMAFIWSPLAATATRNLPPQLAGAGSGVFNTTRQVGSVLGSASMAAFMTSRIGAELPARPSGGAPTEGQAGVLPEFLREPFSAALSQSLLLPAFIALFGVVAALFLRGFGATTPRLVTGLPAPRLPAADQHSVDEHWQDDDDYIEYTVDWSPGHDSPSLRSPGQDPPTDLLPAVDATPPDESLTEPLYAHVEHPLHAPADTWHAGPVDTWQHLEPESEPEPEPEPEPRPVPDPPRPMPDPPRAWRSILDDLLAEPPGDHIGHAHNGFHTDQDGRFQPLQPPADQDDEEPGGRHSRPSRGRHSRDD
ncbi:drug-transport integral membrane protein [Mycolicibacterium canariasense]|uniref:Drug-transport integral membrane protein n=2 Tax=Mycolicibacterium canariasense TaxID=228230 RepID=A0A117IAP1_MYCCR|nr:drug-transport integral membrane protein [Mycolicibacterium canariasense]